MTEHHMNSEGKWDPPLKKNEHFDFEITSDGSVITGVLRQCGHEKKVILAAGTDTNPQVNYVFKLKSNNALKAITSGWPAAPHVKVASTYLQSAESVYHNGLYPGISMYSEDVWCPPFEKEDHVALEKKKRGEVWRKHNELKDELGLIQFDIEKLEQQVDELKHRNKELETMRRLIIKAVKPGAGDFFKPVTDAVKSFGRAVERVMFPKYSEIKED